MKTLGVLAWLSLAISAVIFYTWMTCARAGQVDVVPPKPVYPHHGFTSGPPYPEWTLRHYRCEKSKDATTFTFVPIEKEGNSPKIILSCVNCECTGAK